MEVRIDCYGDSTYESGLLILGGYRINFFGGGGAGELLAAHSKGLVATVAYSRG